MSNCGWQASGCTYDAEYEVSTTGLGRGHVLMCGSCAKIFIDGTSAYHLHHFVWAKHLRDGSTFRKFEKVPDDPVEHPRHYGGGDNPYEAIKVIEAWGLGFCLGNVVKYVARHRHKNGLEDLKKARWYLDREIERLELQARGRAVHPMGEAEPVTALPSDAQILAAALTNLTPEQQDEVTNYLLGCGGAWGSTGTSFRGNWRRPRQPKDIVAALADLTPEEQDSITKDFAGITWGTRRLRSSFSDPKRYAELFPRKVRVRFELAGSAHTTEVDVDLSEPFAVAVEQAVPGFALRGKWETRNSQGDRLLLDEPLDPLFVPDGKVMLCSVPGSGG